MQDFQLYSLENFVNSSVHLHSTTTKHAFREQSLLDSKAKFIRLLISQFDDAERNSTPRKIPTAPGPTERNFVLPVELLRHKPAVQGPLKVSSDSPVQDARVASQACDMEYFYYEKEDCRIGIGGFVIAYNDGKVDILLLNGNIEPNWFPQPIVSGKWSMIIERSHQTPSRVGGTSCTCPIRKYLL